MFDDLTRDSREDGSSDRAFGLVWSAFFLVIAIGPVFFRGAIHTWSLVLSVAFGLVALIVPGLLAPLNRVWTKFGLLLHKVISPLVSGIMFFLVITPTGLVMRLFGKDLLRLHTE